MNKRIYEYKHTSVLSDYLKENRNTTNELAKILGVTTQSIRMWAVSYVPAERVIPLYFATNCKLNPCDVRPDIYPPDLITFKKRRK